MTFIENDQLKAGFLTKGAEWRSLSDKTSGRELLWQADAAFWGKSAPVLFPIVGSLRGGQYRHQGQSYSLGRHGFARDREFAVKEQASDRVTFVLGADETSRAVFPFDWSLEIEYRLWGRTLHTTYRVANRGTGELLFSVGAHPAFNVPLAGGAFEDAYLEFDVAEQPVRWLLDAQGTLSGETRRLPPGKTLPLTHELFAEDALVFKGLKSSRVTLRQKGTTLAVSMEFPGFPFYGIWSAPGAPFVCLEPWCGVADSAAATGKLDEKEGINKLAPGATFTRNFAVTVEGGR
jgi:galactose mutarotase-like enzyme